MPAPARPGAARRASVRPRRDARATPKRTRYGRNGAVEKLEAIKKEALETKAKRARGESVRGGDTALMNLVEKPAFDACLKALTVGGEHPKTTRLREILIDHFDRAQQAGNSSRAMVS